MVECPAGKLAGFFMRLQFKSHPYYDGSDARDWLDVDENADLARSLGLEKQRLSDIALERIRLHAGESYCAEKPHASLNQALFFPIDNHGFQAYIDFVFLQDPDQNTCDSDFWWAIINCPHSNSGRIYVIGIG